MKIYKIIILLFFICCSTRIDAEQYIYVKGITSFEIKENKDNFEVICLRKGQPATSQNKNITDRQLRLQAIDLIGAYIIFKRDYADRIEPVYFQVVVDGINLHYNAVIEEVRSEQIFVNGSSAICYICPKAKYKLEIATYTKNLDLFSLVKDYYTRNKNANSASLLYEFTEFDSHCYVQLENDFHKGNTYLPSSVRRLLQIEDRFERSIYSENEEQLNVVLKQVNEEFIDKQPYSRFCLEELVTSVPLNEKMKYYQEWRETMQKSKTVWEDIIYYCSQRVEYNINKDATCFTDVITSFAGAISPFGIRQPINNEKYFDAVRAYTNLDFRQSVDILKEAIDTEGISPELLNLLGASYRFLDKPHRALPFLLLAFKLNPKTNYLVGNVALCLKMINYPSMDDACHFLMSYAVDEWSKNEIKNLETR